MDVRRLWVHNTWPPTHPSVRCGSLSAIQITGVFPVQTWGRERGMLLEIQLPPRLQEVFSKMYVKKKKKMYVNPV